MQLTRVSPTGGYVFFYNCILQKLRAGGGATTATRQTQVHQTLFYICIGAPDEGYTS